MYLNSPKDEKIAGYNSDEEENGLKWAESIVDGGVEIGDSVITEGLKRMKYDSQQRASIRSYEKNGKNR